jgi:glycosyltransferase involved in cell wall biosynthesis
MTLPTLSVIVPLYNHQSYITAALDSVFRQSLRPDEVVVVDDGSTDSSARLVQQYAEAHPIVRLRRQSNQGAHHAINTGMSEARGDILAILNSDDTYAPERLQESVRVLSEQEHVAAVATALDFMDETGRAIRNPWYETARRYYDEVQDLGVALANGNFIMTTSNLVLRRSAVTELGGFKALRYAHDLDFLLRLLVAGKNIHLIERPLLRYRLHKHNTIKEDHRKVRAEWASAVACFAYHVSKRSGPSAGTWEYLRRLLGVAERHQLTALIFMFLAFFASLPEDQVSSDAFYQHDEFRRQIIELA